LLVVHWPRFSGLVVSTARRLTIFQRSEYRKSVVFGNFKSVSAKAMRVDCFLRWRSKRKELNSESLAGEL
jgi:hypothetical protein